MASIVERWILKLADRYNPSCRSRLSRKADPFSHPHKKSSKFHAISPGPTSQRRPCESDSAAQTTSFFLWLYTKTRTPRPQFLTRGQTTQPHRRNDEARCLCDAVIDDSFRFAPTGREYRRRDSYLRAEPHTRRREARRCRGRTGSMQWTRWMPT